MRGATKLVITVILVLCSSIAGTKIGFAEVRGIDVFVRGNDNVLWEKFNGINYGYGGYAGLGADTFLDSPAAVSTGPNRIDVFVRGLDNALWTKSWNGSAWSGYTQLGADTFLDSPAAVSTGPNRIDVFVRGLDNALWTKSWDGSAWSGYHQLGAGTFRDSPAVTS